MDQMSEAICNHCNANPPRPESFFDGLCDECAGLLETELGHNAWVQSLSRDARRAVFEALNRIAGGKLMRNLAGDELISSWTEDELSTIGSRAIGMAEALWVQP
jgi:hypothetical protein